MSTTNRISTVAHMCEQISRLCDQERLLEKKNRLNFTKTPNEDISSTCLNRVLPPTDTLHAYQMTQKPQLEPGERRVLTPSNTFCYKNVWWCFIICKEGHLCLQPVLEAFCDKKKCSVAKTTVIPNKILYKRYTLAHSGNTCGYSIRLRGSEISLLNTQGHGVPQGRCLPWSVSAWHPRKGWTQFSFFLVFKYKAMTLTFSVSAWTKAVQDGRQRVNVALELHALEMKIHSFEKKKKQGTSAKTNVLESCDESGCCSLPLGFTEKLLNTILMTANPPPHLSPGVLWIQPVRFMIESA